MLTMISNVLPLEWCASPKGCYVDGTGEKVVTQETTPNVLQDTIDNSIGTMLNVGMGSIIKLAVAIVVIVIVFAVIKKLLFAGAAKAKEISLSQLKDAAAYASAALSPEVLLADEKRREKYRQQNAAENSTNGVAGFQDLMDGNQETYLSELERQDKIQKDYDASLSDAAPAYKSQKPYEIDMSLGVMDDSYSNDIFTKQNASTMFAKYNTELKDTDYDIIGTKVASVANDLGLPGVSSRVEQAKKLAQKVKHSRVDGETAKEALKRSLDVSIPYDHEDPTSAESLKQAKDEIDEKLRKLMKHRNG